jgi:serine/threonine protein phosphatase 1
MSRVQRFGKNEVGRDFVTGDIHACYSLVWQALQAASFHPGRDRLFCVGDLVDRGLEPERVEAFLRQPWVHSILGNHECMLLELYEDGEPPESALRAYMNMYGARNGMAWWLDVAVEQRRRIIEAFRKLPYVIELKTARGSVGLVHAEVPAGMGWQAFVSRVEAGDRKTLKIATWGRDRVGAADDAGVEGIDRVFVGHTPQRAATRLGNVYYVDTGAFLNVLGNREAAHLTFADVTAKTQILSAPPASVDGVNLLTEVPAAPEPFGAYSRSAR